jgi:hypothetical protein
VYGIFAPLFFINAEQKTHTPFFFLDRLTRMIVSKRPAAPTETVEVQTEPSIVVPVAEVTLTSSSPPEEAEPSTAEHSTAEIVYRLSDSEPIAITSLRRVSKTPKGKCFTCPSRVDLYTRETLIPHQLASDFGYVFDGSHRVPNIFVDVNRKDKTGNVQEYPRKRLLDTKINPNKAEDQIILGTTSLRAFKYVIDPRMSAYKKKRTTQKIQQEGAAAAGAAVAGADGGDSEGHTSQ